MAIIVGDIHGHVEKVQTFLAYKPDEIHVCLGDYLDSFQEPSSRQILALQLLLSSDAVLLLGNHDLHYLKAPLFQYPGYQTDHAALYQDILEASIDRFKPSHVADGWLCTHAGVHRRYTDHENDVTLLSNMFNSEWDLYLKNRLITNISSYRYKSIFRFDFMAEDALVPTNIKQIFGHDELSTVEFINQSCVSIASNSRELVYLFDTGTESIIEIPIQEQG